MAVVEPKPGHGLAVRRRRDGSLGLMGHVIVDHPGPRDVRAMVGVMAGVGVDVIELQIPFSEPMADGPTFLAANHAALARGVGYAACLRLMRELATAHPAVRFVFMSYLNPIYKRGYAAFAADTAGAGGKGVIVPDLPVEFAAELDCALAAHALVNVRLIAPNAAPARVAELAGSARGLIYAVARGGVTGAHSDFAAAAALVARIRAGTDVPVAVGFGVRTPEDVRQLRGVADLAIVGTASLATFQDKGLAGFAAFWTALAAAASG